MSNDATPASVPLLSVKNLEKHYKVSSAFGKGSTVRAVDGITFDLQSGKTLGLVGESGCGKSTAGRTVLNLESPTAGEVLFEGTNIAHLSSESMRALRRDMQIIFQDPYASLNGRMRVQQILSEPYEIHRLYSGQQLKERIKQLLDTVGLPESSLTKHPHEFSGGQRQRIGIARAIALNPKFVVCDEPVSALDVSVQAQIINLFRRLQRELGLTYLFISHDLSIIRLISERVAVMYLGKLVELGETRDIFSLPLHPYTKTLISAIPRPDPKSQRMRRRIIPQGELPSPANPPTGCRFHTRCPFAEEKCKNEVPEWREVKQNHWVACHFAPFDMDSSSAGKPT